MVGTAVTASPVVVATAVAGCADEVLQDDDVQQQSEFVVADFFSVVVEANCGPNHRTMVSCTEGGNNPVAASFSNTHLVAHIKKGTMAEYGMQTPPMQQAPVIVMMIVMKKVVVG